MLLWPRRSLRPPHSLALQLSVPHSPCKRSQSQQQEAMALLRPLQASLPSLLQRWGAALHTSTSLRGVEELIVLPPKEDEKEPTTGALRLGSCACRRHCRCRRRRRSAAPFVPVTVQLRLACCRTRLGGKGPAAKELGRPPQALVRCGCLRAPCACCYGEWSIACRRLQHVRSPHICCSGLLNASELVGRLRQVCLAGGAPLELSCCCWPSQAQRSPTLCPALSPCRFVLLKERTRLHAEKQMYRGRSERMPDPSRIGKVRKSMARIKHVGIGTASARAWLEGWLVRLVR